MATVLRGRQREAARNDRAILEAARVVFLRDPDATMHQVAAEAGVGVGGLYRRYSGKEELLRTICADGLRRSIAIGEAALADTDDPWSAFSTYLERTVDAGVHQLTVRLAGRFTVTDELVALSEQSQAMAERVFRFARGAGVLRRDVTLTDLTFLSEQIAAISLGSDVRTAELRHRYLRVLLDGLRSDATTMQLPGPPPSEEELARRWRRAEEAG
jgi:AcrR family transcriptional regulator